MSDDTILRAKDSYERDRRFRAMVDSVAHEAYGKHYFDGENDKCARDAITLAAALMLQRIYDEDAELRWLRGMVERLTDAWLKFGHTAIPATYLTFREGQKE